MVQQWSEKVSHQERVALQKRRAGDFSASFSEELLGRLFGGQTITIFRDLRPSKGSDAYPPFLVVPSGSYSHPGRVFG